MRPKLELSTSTTIPTRPAAGAQDPSSPLLRSPRRSRGVSLVLNDTKDTLLPPVIAADPRKRGGGGRPKKEAARKAPKDSGRVQLNVGSLARDDVKCAICLEIFVEPVTYPCGHSACLACYKEHVEKTSMQCHLCRSRLSVWSRAAFKNNSLVNLPFWEKIQEQYAAEIEAREDGDAQNLLSRSPRREKVLDGTVASQGEIFQEFDEQRKRFSKELQVERQREETASLELIKKLQEEEGPLPLVQCASELEKDLELARLLQEELLAEPSPPVPVPVAVARPKRATIVAPNPLRNQSQLTFKPSVPPSATVSSLEEQERQTPPPPPSLDDTLPVPTLEPPLAPHSSSQIDEDFKLAKKLQQEERKAVLQERQAKLERMNTRFLSKSRSGTGSNDKKRQSPRPSTSSQGSKRRKQDLSQGTLDTYFSASPPSAAVAARPPTPPPPSPSRSSTPDSINAEFNHHFQPIVRPPKTPPKRNPDGTVERTVFVNLKSRVSPHKNLSSAFIPPTKED